VDLKSGSIDYVVRGSKSVVNTLNAGAKVLSHQDLLMMLINNQP
jgi:hypothetical protein